jgi:excisionase family DNA binding protein
MSKIQKAHLERAAYIYVRQSSLSQVEHNLESQRRQYALVERAQELGWQDIRVVDEDLGRSGSGHVKREGFETLLAEVCQGQVGGVFAVEASRLARNGHEWHRLLEFCAIVDTLIVDHDGIYDSAHPNDRLVLGLKGTMSEMEVSMFRQRSQEAIRRKARRGEYYTRVPEGYVLGEDGTLDKDPDERVHAAMELLFEKFRELSSARQVHLWFRQEDIKLPRRLGKASGVEFVPATPGLVVRLLRDPTYAGTYAFGRTKRRVTLDEGRKRIKKWRVSRPEDWEVLIQGHHEGYVSWSEYLKDLETLANNQNRRGEAVRGPARRGRGLLAGLVRCGHCGKKMQVRYGGGRSGRASAAVYYQCRASQREQIGKQLCSIFGGVTVENAVVEAVLEAILPVRMEALVDARERLTSARTEKRQQLEFELERAHYEAERCQRQYDAVEPENRQVARNLEHRWEDALERVNDLNDKLSQFDATQPPMTPDEQDALRRLSEDLPQLWHHDAAPLDLKKRVVRTVIKEVVVFVEKVNLRVLVHWHGGQHSEFNLRKRKSGEHRWKTTESTLSLIEQLARVMSDKQIAAQLNRMGIKSAKEHTWTRLRVGSFRKSNNIANYTPGERQARGELTVEETAEKLGVSYSTVQRMIQRNQLRGAQICPGAPWIIRSEDLDALCVEGRADKGRRAAPSSGLSGQRTLEFS